MSKSTPLSNSSSARSRRGAFTLIEILVAVAILGVMLTIILVPLRLGFNTFAIGKSRSEVQQQAQLIVNQIAGDLRKSQFVFANSYVEGVTNNTRPTSKCSPPSYPGPATAPTVADWNYRPYVRTTDPANVGSPSATTSYGVCSAKVSGSGVGMSGFNNSARIDMLQQRRDNSGKLIDTEAGQDFMVTYYARRADINKPFDVVDNPVVLYRAQIPFRYRQSSNGAPGAPYMINTSNNEYNADVDWTHLPALIGACGTGANAPRNRSFLWLTHNYNGEADLAPLATDADGGSGTVPVPGSHTLITPRNMSLVAPNANNGTIDSMVPELSFREESSDGKHIDRVTISLTLAQYDQTGSGTSNDQTPAQRVHVSQTVDLTSPACGP